MWFVIFLKYIYTLIQGPLVTCIEVDHAIVIPDHESRPDFVIEGKEPMGVWQEDGAELQVGLLDIPPDNFLVG